MAYSTYIELDENKVKDLWIHEFNPEKSIDNAICISIRNTPRLLMCGCENPDLKDEMGCYLYAYENNEVRPVTNEELVYEIEHIKYYLYAKYDENGNVIKILNDKLQRYIEGETNLIRLDRVYGDQNKAERKYNINDENGYPNYRVIDGEMVEIPLQEKIDSVKMSKLNEFKITCSEKFENGISIGEDNYSLTQEDQINIQSLYINALNNKFPLLYHANGKVMREYTKEEVIELYNKMEEFKNKNLLLYNYLKATINECDDAEYINSMEYNESSLSDKYKELFNK